MTMSTTDKNRGRQRAQRLFPAIKCSSCSTVGVRLERHHVDGNPLNNDPSNVVVLCVRCHMQADGRLEASIERLRTQGRRAPRLYKGTTCTVDGCERPAKYRALCNTHYYRMLRTGAPGGAEIRAYGNQR